MPFLDKPVKGWATIKDREGRVRYIPEDYDRRKRLLRRAKRGDRAAVRALWASYRCEVWAP